MFPVLPLTVLGFQSHAQSPQLQELDAVVKEYVAFGLPVAPVGAQLVCVKTRLPNGTAYVAYIGYLLGKKTDGSLSMLVGTNEIYLPPSAGDIEALSTDPKLLPMAALSLEVGFSAQEAELPIAVSERLRGHYDLALAMLRRPTAAQYVLGTHWTLHARLSLLELQSCKAQLVQPNSDRGRVLKTMEALFKDTPELATKENQEILEGLEMTVTHPTTGNTGYDRMVDALCDCTQSIGFYGFSEQRPVASRAFLPVTEILGEGFDIVPTLIAHVDDKRFTRALYASPLSLGRSIQTVGDVCIDILNEYRGRHSLTRYGDETNEAVLRDWWENAKAIGERDAATRTLLACKEWPGELLVRLIRTRHPEAIAPSYLECLQRPDAKAAGALINELCKSDLPATDKIAYCLQGIHSSNRTAEHYSLLQLNQLDRATFEKEMLTILHNMPAHLAGSAMYSPEAGMAEVCGFSDSAVVWKALEDAAKRADANLRAALISRAVAPSVDAKEVLELKYLQAFFGDATRLSNTSEVPWGEAMIKNLAMREAAWLLSIEVPRTNLSQEGWDSLRSQLERRISELGIKNAGTA